jgi:hypothetical protein
MWSSLSSVDEPKGGIAAVGKSGRSEALAVGIVLRMRSSMVMMMIVLEPVGLSFEEQVLSVITGGLEVLEQPSQSTRLQQWFIQMLH